MFGFKGNAVFCPLHPYKKCAHFCQDHSVLLCTICLRNKHRGCNIADPSAMTTFYSRQIQTGRDVIHSEVTETLPQTQAVLVALDNGITRLKQYNQHIDTVLIRLHELKDEVEAQRKDVGKSVSSLKYVERSMASATELQQCKQCFCDIDIERIKFERKQQRILKTPVRVNGDIKLEFDGLTKEVKSIRKDVKSQILACVTHTDVNFQKYGLSKTVREAYNNQPYMMIRKKYTQHRKRLPMIKKRSDDGRETFVPPVKYIRLPSIVDNTHPQPHAVIQFSEDDSQWHLT